MSDPGIIRRWCVVLLTGSSCEAYPGVPCVMTALGPYTAREAQAEAAKQPAWAMPHVVSLRKADE